MSDQMVFARSPDDIPGRDVLLSMCGLDYMQAMLRGEVPAPTIAQMMNYRLSHVEAGHVKVRGAPQFGHTNPFGAVHGGWYGTLLDTVMACTIMTAIPKGRWYTTLEYKINITRALPIGHEVEAEGVIDHAGKSTAVAHGVIKGASDGRIYATGSTTCIIMG